MTTVRTVTEKFILHDDATDKTIEILTSSEETEFHLEAFPVCGGDDELTLTMSLQEMTDLYYWLANVLGMGE